MAAAQAQHAEHNRGERDKDRYERDVTEFDNRFQPLDIDYS